MEVRAALLAKAERDRRRKQEGGGSSSSGVKTATQSPSANRGWSVSSLFGMLAILALSLSLIASSDDSISGNLKRSVGGECMPPIEGCEEGFEWQKVTCQCDITIKQETERAMQR